YAMGIPYEYERPLQGTDHDTGRVRKLRPDFSFIDAAGDVVVWEHAGMLGRSDYRRGWEWKQEWYRANGFSEGEGFFATYDDERGGLDSTKLQQVAEAIAEKVST